MNSGAGAPSASKSASSRRAVGVVRVSRVGGREGETFVSPSEQRERIDGACSRDGLELVDVFEELDVSGGASIEQRPGLGRALAAVEDGDADVIVVAYFDRLVRSVARQAEILERVERAGGAILAVDVGEVRADTASHWLSSTMLGAVAEYHRRVTAERTADAKRRAIARGVPTFARIPPGYRQQDDGRIEPDPSTAPAVAAVFEMRAGGATVRECRDYLREHGVERSYHGVQAMLGSRIYLGELHFGDLENLTAHEPLVERNVWQRVQRVAVPRGRRAKSERLLARLGVLRCGTCGSRMVVGTAHNGEYALYRCSPVGDCPRRVTVSATLAEDVVVARVRLLLSGVRGTAVLTDDTAAVERELDACERELDAAVRAFSGLDDVEAARERLLELHAARDAARDRLAELRAATAPALSIDADDDWDILTLDEQRALICAVIERVDVSPGRGADRLAVHARNQYSASSTV